METLSALHWPTIEDISALPENTNHSFMCVICFLLFIYFCVRYYRELQ